METDEVHDLVDLLAEHLAERATEHGEVLAEDAHLAAVDRPEAGDHPVGVGPPGLEAHPRRAVAGQEVQLLEAVGVEEVLDALAGRHLAPFVLALDRLRRAGVAGLLLAALQFGESLPDGVFGHGPEATGTATVTPWSAGMIVACRAIRRRPRGRCRTRRPPSEATWSASAPTSSRGRSSPPTGQACSRCRWRACSAWWSPDPRAVLPLDGLRGEPVAAPIVPALRGADRHRLRRRHRRLRRPGAAQRMDRRPRPRRV